MVASRSHKRRDTSGRNIIMPYEVDKVAEEDDDDTWDASDWSYVVKSNSEIICICASAEEAEHIAELLNDKPYRP